MPFEKTGARAASGNYLFEERRGMFLIGHNEKHASAVTTRGFYMKVEETN